MDNVVTAVLDLLQISTQMKTAILGLHSLLFRLSFLQHEHVGLWVTGVYLVLVSPVLLLYRSLDPERVTREQLYMAAEDAGAKERSAV